MAAMPFIAAFPGGAACFSTPDRVRQPRFCQTRTQSTFVCSSSGELASGSDSPPVYMLRMRNMRVFVVSQVGQLIIRRPSRNHVTRVGVQRIAYVWKRLVRFFRCGCQLLSLIAFAGDGQMKSAELRWIVPVKTLGSLP